MHSVPDHSHSMDTGSFINPTSRVQNHFGRIGWLSAGGAPLAVFDGDNAPAQSIPILIPKKWDGYYGSELWDDKIFMEWDANDNLIESANTAVRGCTEGIFF